MKLVGINQRPVLEATKAHVPRQLFQAGHLSTAQVILQPQPVRQLRRQRLVILRLQPILYQYDLQETLFKKVLIRKRTPLEWRRL